MTATVVDLASHRRNHAPARRCGCRAGYACYPHRLDALAARLADLFDRTDGHLLIARDLLAEAVVDAVSVLDGITGECLPEDERNTR
jgi:hypothetical protein